MDFIFDPSLALYLPLYELDGASFMSKDAYGHSCTAIGALWRPNGRWLDGINDYINCGADTSFDISGTMTLEVWMKRTSAGVWGYEIARDSCWDSTRMENWLAPP